MEQNHRQGISSGRVPGDSDGGNNSKSANRKQKQKKVPQRGLGVAQLEKIRLEEQQKKAAAAAIRFPPPAPPPPPPPTCLSTIPNFNHSHSSSSSSVPFPSPTGLPSPHSRFCPASPANPCGGENCFSAAAAAGGRVDGRCPAIQVPKMWNCNYVVEEESPSNLRNSAYESMPIWPLPVVVQRTMQLQQPPPMVTVPSATSPTSAVMNLHVEPPSNQSYCSNLIPPPMWQDESNMVGLKRAYPFCVEYPTSAGAGPHLQTNFPAFIHNHHHHHHHISNSEESACRGNEASSFMIGPHSNPISYPIREDPSCSNSMHERTENLNTRNGNMDGHIDFLTLAPAASKPPPLPPPLPFHGGDDSSDQYEPLHLHQTRDTDGSMEAAPFYSFLSPAKPAQSVDNVDEEKQEGVDLSLKL